MRRAWRLFAIAPIILMVCVTLPLPSLADARTVKLSADAEEIYSVEFFIDPQHQTSSAVEDAPGQNIALTDFTSEFLLHNRLVFYTRFKNISDNRNFDQRFFFTLTEDAHGKNILSTRIPLVTDADLGGDGVLSPGEETSQLRFEVRHKGKPFSFFVHAHAVVRAVEIAEIPADKIAVAGHGKLFDKDMNEIELDTSLITEIQDSMIDQIIKASEAAKDSTVQNAQKLLKSHNFTIDTKIIIKSAIINKLLQAASEPLITKYVWRNSAVLSQYLTFHPNSIQSLPQQILDLLKRLDFFLIEPVPETNYMADCRAHRVPIPPNWELKANCPTPPCDPLAAGPESETPWVFQGVLTQNLLKKQLSLNVDPIPFGENDSAAVYTYSDPTVRGACIALPRGTGAPGSPAGIICQSAETGHACIWDNVPRNADPPTAEVALGWRDRRLVISELKDMSNLLGGTGICTDCHRGNNVFLISPDDPTWGKVLRGPLSGLSTGTFTTQVEASSDNRGGHPRYIPITTLPERPGWENTFAANCAGRCHEIPRVDIPQPMPPLCARSPTDPSTCYGTP